MRTTSRDVARAAQVRRAVTALAARSRVERRGELNLNEVAALGRITVHGPVTPGEVADQLRALPQSLTRTFASLESAGYIERTPHPEDGRQSLLVATGRGRAALRAEMAPRDRWIAAAMAAVLSEEERAQVLAAAPLIERLADYDAGIAMVER